VALNKKRVAFAVAILCTVVLSIAATVYLYQQNDPKIALTKALPPVQKMSIEDMPDLPKLKYGIVVDSMNVVEDKIRKNEFLASILEKYNVPYQDIDKLSRKARKTFDVRKLRSGKKYTILTDKKTPAKAQFFIYDPDPYFYVIYDLRDTLGIKKVEREIEVRERIASGVIESSMWNTMMDNGLSMDLAANMEDVFGWVIDFHHVQRGDRFKVIFDEKYIDNQRVGVGRIHGGVFRHYDDDTYAMYFEPNKEKFVGYYDGEGESMKRTFLRAPLKYSRISSGYGMRYHPIKRRRKAHLGTDYAAPIGTPIYSVGDGTISKASYTRGNGKYIKIRHNKKYSTQYLHMNGFAKGMRVGKKVKQGEVIGYVGKTGMATGPHVCFRFWKDGRQVNHRRLKFPPPEPMPKSLKPNFQQLRDSMVNLIDGIAFPATQADSLSRDVSEVISSGSGKQILE